jgi:predicted extracellular nuclease
MKKNLLALSISTALSFGASADIMITEYVEGSGYNKAIEIGNTGDTSVDITGYKLVRYTNGDISKPNELALGGILAANEVQVLVGSNTGLHQELKDLADVVSSTINHNGDDPYELFDADGNLLDQVGEFGDVNYGKDKTLQRAVLTPSLTYDATKFSVHAKDSWADLGHLAEAGEPGEPEPPVEATPETIMGLQGNSWSSPFTDPANAKYLSDETFIVDGIVTAIQTGSLGNDLPTGFFMQDETGDANPNTSDGIFVTGKITGLAVGDEVTVTGKVNEDYGWTKIQPSAVDVTGTGSITAIPIMPLESDEDFDFTLERHEGMLVQFAKDSDMRVTRTYGFDYGPRRNNMVLSHGAPNLHPNQANPPVVHDGVIDTPAEAQADSNKDKRIVVESIRQAPDGAPLWYPTFGDDNGTGATNNYIRIGDVVDGLEGVVGYSYSDFRVYVTTEATTDTFIHENDRVDTPPLSGEGLRIGTFNVLNYFNSPFGGDQNPTNTNRGAKNAADFARQGDKIAAAIIAMNADIVGLMEIENNGFGADSAVAHLVDKLNERLAEENQYAYVTGNQNDTFVGSDAIANQVIYKPAKVTLDTYRVIKMPEQHAGQTGNENGDNYQRDAITPTFNVTGTDEKVTVSVNHFKSKGSTCWEDVAQQGGKDPDLQGSCENLRVSAAQHLGSELAKIEGNKLILGDLNSYASEDPILLLTALPDDHPVMPARMTFIDGTPMDGEHPAAITTSFGFKNVIKDKYPLSYGYSYNDTLGTLDYILVDADTAAKVVDAVQWNINAVESTMFEYSTQYSGELEKFNDMYRASDHDPAIVILNVTGTVTPPDPTPTPDPEEEEEENAGSTGIFRLLFALFWFLTL